MLEFEWDDEKAERNLRKHGVSFEAAAQAFNDPFVVELEPGVATDGELRFAIVGMSGGRHLFMAYAERSGRVRIISARRATSHERKRYSEG